MPKLPAMKSILIPAMVAALLVAANESARAGELRAGAAAVKITPPIGTPMAGYYSLRPAEGVHDDLYAKAIVLEKDGVKAALVSLDLITTTRGIVEEARREITRTSGLPIDSVMISATHAHTGPMLGGWGAFDAEFGGNNEMVKRYTADLPVKIAEAVRLADAALKPVRVCAATGYEDSIAFNRRFFMKDGTVGWNPGKLNPNIVTPAGPIDPEVQLVYFESTNGAPTAAYINYTVHLDNVGGAQFSADMPYTLSRLMAEVKGPSLVTLYTTGTCGDVNHVDVQSPMPQGGHENAERMGIILAADVFRLFPRIQPFAASALRSSRAIVPLPLPQIQPGAVENAQKTIARLRDEKSAKPSFLETVEAFKVLDVAAQEGKPIQAEVQVIALGNQVAWVSLPGEVFVELGLAIKRASPFKHTLIAELANGSVNYIPTRRAFAHGNYEVVSARCAEGSGELLVDAAVRLLQELHK